jgi:hypothetical protein
VELYYDSPFNTFKPISRNVAEEKTLRANKAFSALDLGAGHTTPFLSLNADVENFLGSENFAAYLSASPDQAGEDINWVEHSIIDLLKRDKKLNASQISQYLDLSANTVTRILETRKIKFK